MPPPYIFGMPEPHIHYTERRAAYVVVSNQVGQVATVKPRQKHFLPGGGAWPGEAPAATVVREVREELARNVRLLRQLGEVVQYFYATTDDRYYKMQATLFVGEFTAAPCVGVPEHELHWLPIAAADEACFHACHAWAIRQVCREPGSVPLHETGYPGTSLCWLPPGSASDAS